jgi:hypothetical protein
MQHQFTKAENQTKRAEMYIIHHPKMRWWQTNRQTPHRHMREFVSAKQDEVRKGRMDGANA